MECPICSIHFSTSSNIPKIVSCEHTFCHVYLERMTNQAVILCPNCRRKTKLSSKKSSKEAVASLLTNYALLEDAPIENTIYPVNVKKNIPNRKKSKNNYPIPVQPVSHSSNTQVSPIQATRLEPEEKRDVQNTNNENRNNHGCCLKFALLICPLIMFVLFTTVHILLVAGTLLSIAYIGILCYGNVAESNYLIPSICLAITITFVMIFAYPLVSFLFCKYFDEHCCSAVGKCKKALIYFLIIFTILQAFATVYALIVLIYDDEPDSEDYLYKFAIISQVFTYLVLLCMTFIPFVQCFAEKYNLQRQ